MPPTTILSRGWDESSSSCCNGDCSGSEHVGFHFERVGVFCHIATREREETTGSERVRLKNLSGYRIGSKREISRRNEVRVVGVKCCMVTCDGKLVGIPYTDVP